MKKILLILLCLSILFSAVACNMKSNDDTTGTELNETASSQNPSIKKQNPLDSNDEGDYKNKFIDGEESLQTKRDHYFYQYIDKNPYDQWLKNELTKGERAEKNIYAEYLAFWKEELIFTTENAQELFDDKGQYEQWKNDIEQWCVISQDVLKTEMNMMNCTLGQLEVIIPYCEMVRQKVIDTKRFLYYYQAYTLAVEYSDIELSWSKEIK